MSATAAELQVEFRRLRDEFHETGDGRQEARRAYDAWFHQSCLEGRPPDGLDRYGGTDEQRFFARTIPGPDGHTFWDGSLESGFRLGKGGSRLPRWWWYEHVNGTQSRGTLGSVCGQINCITPDHQQYVSWAESKRRYTDQQMLGSLQVAAERLGQTPTRQAYRDLGLKPCHEIIAVRFGGWGGALSAAGLEPHRERMQATEAECFAALRFIAELTGRRPTEDLFREHAAELRAAGLHSSPSTVYRCLGSWVTALEKAGLSSSTAPPRTSTPGP